ALAVLDYLVRRPGRLVTKEELLHAVWADALVTDASLKVCVREIRKVLQDDADAPRFIETAHRRGYRFVGRVRAADAPDPEPPNGTAPAASAEPPPPDEAAPPLVGRESELGELQRLLDQAVNGSRQVVFVTGEPGSGKTTLVEAFRRRAAGQKVCVTAGQCFEHFGRGEAYQPLLEALRRLEGELGADVVAALVREHAPTWRGQRPG